LKPKHVIIIALSPVIAFIIYGGMLIVQAEINPTDRFFQKDFCIAENNLLSDILYLDLTELSYDSGGCPVSTIAVHKWGELTIASQNLITNRLALQGYVDVTEGGVSASGR